MRPTTGYIAELTLTATRRLHRLMDLSLCLAAPVTPIDRRLIAYVTVEAANLWAQYSRCLYMSCAFGGRDASGVVTVSARANTADDALTWAVHALHPKLRGKSGGWRPGQLPDFQNKGSLRKTIGYLGATVFPDVDSALSVKTRVLADLPTARNYFAHKAERGARSARNLAPRYGLARRDSIEDLLCAVPAGGSDILLREWLADVHAILGLMP